MSPTAARVRTLFDRAAEDAAGDAAALLGADVACVTFPDRVDEPAGSVLVYFSLREAGRRITGSRVDTERTARFGAVLATGAEFAGDLADDPDPPAGLRQRGVRAYLLVPIRLSGETAPRGVLYLARLEPRPFSATEQEQARHLAAMIGRSLERARRQVRTEEQLDSLARAIAAGATRDEAMQAALRAIMAAAEADTAVVQVLEGDQIVYRTFLDRTGRRRSFGKDAATPVRPGGATEEVLRTHQPVLLPDLAKCASLHPATRARGSRSSAHVPVFIDDAVVATLNAEWQAPGACTAERVAQLERFAAYLAVALSHLRQREAVERRATEQRLLAAATAAIAAAPDAVSAVDAFLHGVRALTDATALRAVVHPSAASPGFERDLAAATEPAETSREPDPSATARPEATGGAGVAAVELVSVEQDVDGRRQLVVPLRAGGGVVGTLRADLPPGAIQATEQRMAVEALTGAVGAAIARAELVEAEQAAAERAVLAQQQLTAALHSSATMVITYDLDGVIESVTGASVAVLGWAPEELVGQPMTVLLLPEDRQRFARKLALRRAGGRDLIQYETLNRHRDGHKVPVFITSGPRLERGVVVGGAGAVTDLTRLHRLEQERDEAQAARTRAETAIRTGRAVVHELASPLGAVLGLAELLATSADLPPGVQHDLQLLHAEVMRVGGLLQRFGQIVRYEERPSPAGPQLDLERASGTAATGAR